MRSLLDLPTELIHKITGFLSYTPYRDLTRVNRSVRYILPSRLATRAAWLAANGFSADSSPKLRIRSSEADEDVLYTCPFCCKARWLASFFACGCCKSEAELMRWAIWSWEDGRDATWAELLPDGALLFVYKHDNRQPFPYNPGHKWEGLCAVCRKQDGRLRRY